ncbi:MAG: helix-turn-helix domain-containing protein [Planctomycetes bacterium]|nr:helix-turn-helix domain-containing protein [Planctomycetota bacterium]
MPSTTTAADLLEGVPNFCTIDETAKLLRCSRRHINRLIAKRILVFVKLGSERGCKVLVPRKAIAAYIAQYLG